MSRSIRTLATALALTLGVTLAGTSAASADVGDPTIAYGNVTEGNTGAALTNLQVAVFDADPAGGSVDPVAPVTLKADDPSIPGDYQVALPAGHYWLTMSADDHKTLTVEKDVSETSGGYQNLGGDYLDLSTGTLAGSVTADGDPYGCADIEIYDATGNGADYTDYAYTGALEDEGAFSTELAIGTYKLLVADGCEDGYVSQWVGGTSFATATTFTVTADQTTTVPTVALFDGATVSGLVQKAGAVGLDDVDVSLATESGAVLLDGTVTSSGGKYSLRHVAPGTYQLQFSDPLGEYEPTTRQVTVADDDVTVPATALLAKPASVDTNKLKGKVTGPTKAGIGAMYVRVFDPEDYEYVTTARTRRDGTYSVNVPEGTYKVQFTGARHFEDEGDEPSFSDDAPPTYRAEWFDNSLSYYRAKSVTVGTSAVTANAELVKNAVISGKVKLPADYDPAEWDLTVLAYDKDDNLRAGTYAEEDGSYRFAGLAPGTYRILVDDEAYEDEDGNPFDSFIRQFYAKKYTLGSATAIVAGNGAVVTGRDVTLSDQLSAISAPKVSGTAKKGKKLYASVGSWTASVDTSYGYQWYRGSSRISGATGSTYTLGSSDVGKQVKVVVTASNDYDNYYPGSSTSSLTKKVVK